MGRVLVEIGEQVLTPEERCIAQLNGHFQHVQ